MELYIQPTYKTFETTVVVGKVTPIARKLPAPDVVQLSARAVPSSLIRMIILFPFTGDPVVEAGKDSELARAVTTY